MVVGFSVWVPLCLDGQLTLSAHYLLSPHTIQVLGSRLHGMREPITVVALRGWLAYVVSSTGRHRFDAVPESGFGSRFLRADVWVVDCRLVHAVCILRAPNGCAEPTGTLGDWLAQAVTVASSARQAGDVVRGFAASSSGQSRHGKIGPMQTTPARTRVAPSPTGDPHVGTAYQAIFDVACARQTGGHFVLRIEDTDQARLVPGSEQQIYDTLAWLGLDPDESPVAGGSFGPYRQSERLDTYAPVVQQLIDAGHAYHCWCTPERLADLRAQQAAAKTPNSGYDRLCYGLTRDERAKLPGFSETPVVRMLIPDDVPLEFDDLIRGRVACPRPDDQVILKADGFPTYHLAVVVDDHLMGITHAVRGEEWISSTPKHLLLYRWLGWDEPAFAHMPLLRNTDKSKISKRKNPAARLMWFREHGYLPEALVNFLSLLAYPPVHDGTDVQTFDEFVAVFDWAKVNTTGPVVDLAKLDWLNGAYIRELSDDELASRILAHWRQTGKAAQADDSWVADRLRQAVPIIKPRLTTLADAYPTIDFLLLDDDATLAVDDDARAGLPAESAPILAAAITALSGDDDFTAELIEAALREALVDGLGLKPRVAFNPVRTAIAGRKVSPPLFESMAILGRASCLRRLRWLSQTSASMAPTGS